MRTWLARPGARRLAHALMALWVGAMIAQAFLAAPLVFASVPEHVATKDAAARIIGPAFARIDALGIAATLLLLGVYLARGEARGWRCMLAGILLLGAAVDCFYIAPRIIERQEPLAVFHGTATAIWMVAMIAGLVLVLFPLRKYPANANPG